MKLYLYLILILVRSYIKNQFDSIQIINYT